MTTPVRCTEAEYNAAYDRCWEYVELRRRHIRITPSALWWGRKGGACAWFYCSKCDRRWGIRLGGLMREYHAEGCPCDPKMEPKCPHDSRYPFLEVGG